MFDLIVETYGYAYALRALGASVLVGAMCGILGCFIFLRNMALIGDALSHAILPGVVAGFVVAGYNLSAFFLGAVAAGLLAGFLITWIQKNVRSKDDAVIGIVFSVMFSLGVMGISILSRKEGVHLDLKDFLFGNVLGITPQDLWLTVLVFLFVVSSVWLFFRYLFIISFSQVMARSMGISVEAVHYFLMLLLSFSIVASLQSVGVILVVGMLIIPASAAYLLTDRLQMMVVFSALIGVVSTSLGLTLAIAFQTTPGPAMTLVAGFIYFLVVVFAPKRGWFFRKLRSSRQKAVRLEEDILKLISLAIEKGVDPSERYLMQALKLSEGQIRNSCLKLEKAGLVINESGKWKPTENGLKHAYQLVRAHRLWESYLVEEMGLETTQVHRQAEELEHLLTPTIMQEIEQVVRNPFIDPHGSVIPQLAVVGDLYLHQIPQGNAVLLVSNQPTPDVLAFWWNKGISPNTIIVVETAGGTNIKTESMLVNVPEEVAKKTMVKPLN